MARSTLLLPVLGLVESALSSMTTPTRLNALAKVLGEPPTLSLPLPFFRPPDSGQPVLVSPVVDRVVCRRRERASTVLTRACVCLWRGGGGDREGYVENASAAQRRRRRALAGTG